MPYHLFHDQGIADDEAHHSWHIAPRLPAQNRAQIELHKNHQFCPAETLLNCALQFSESLCTFCRFCEFRHVRLSDRRLERRHNLLDRFGRRYTEPFNFELSDRHASSSSMGDAKRNQAAWAAVR